MDEETLERNSDRPLLTVSISHFPQNLVFPMRSVFLPGRQKYTSGSTPPIVWLMTVARAAPSTPIPKAPRKTPSKIMLANPAASVTYRPKCGFDAVTKKTWNMYCRMN